MHFSNPSVPKDTLTDEHSLLAQFFEYTPDLLCIATFEGRFLKVNPAVGSTLGYSEEELLRMEVKDLVAEEDRKETAFTRDRMLDGAPLVNFENRYITKSGELVWLSWTSVPLHEKGYIFAIAKNVSQRKESERQQQLLFEEISRINKELEHFARLASHNLRSPLANIMSLFDLISYEKLGNEDNLNVINLIKKSTERLNTTLESYISELVQKESNAKLHVETLDIEQYLTETCESVRSLILKSGAIIKADFSAFREIDFNKNYLESILLNLLTNALKYSKPKVKPHITFKTLMSTQGKQLIVSDNGVGFEMKKVKDRIFGLNQTFHANSDAKGLGLFLVKKHVTELGGTITVDSARNKGTTFTITFKS